MKHIKKFNENTDNNKVKYINFHKNTPSGDVPLDGRTKTIPGTNLTYDTAHCDNGTECVVIMEDGVQKVVIRESDIFGEFTFGDIIVVPGHDSITCYNFKTGESKTSYIR